MCFLSSVGIWDTTAMLAKTERPFVMTNAMLAKTERPFVMTNAMLAKIDRQAEPL